MKNIRFTIFVLFIFFIGCKSNNAQFNYELEDSDESYVMDDWSEAQKEDYYDKVGDLITMFLSWEDYEVPAKEDFSSKIKNALGVEVSMNSTYQIINQIQNNGEGDENLNLIIFPKQRILAFSNELPLLDSVSVKHYKSDDYKTLDHSSDNNLLLNKLIFYPPVDDTNYSDISGLLENNFNFKGAKNINSILKYDLNEDGLEDKILIYENNSESDEFNKKHFGLDVDIKKATSKGFEKWTRNNNIIFQVSNNCPSEGFQGIVFKKNFFTIEQQTCYDYTILVSSYTTFKVVDNQIILHKYGEEYFDKANHESKIPAKIWTTNDFGNIKFEDVTEDFLIQLRQKEPKE